MAGTTIINKFGKMQGWNNVTLNLLGRDVEGITELEYSDSTEKENIPGAGKFPIGRGEGNYEAKASITLHKEEYDALQAALPGRRLAEILPFDAVVEYAMSDGKIQKDRLRNVEFTGRGVQVKQGDKSIVYKSELILSHIEWDVN